MSDVSRLAIRERDPHQRELPEHAWASLGHAQCATRRLTHSQDAEEAAIWALRSGVSDPAVYLIAHCWRVLDIRGAAPDVLEIAAGLQPTWRGDRSELLKTPTAA